MTTNLVESPSSCLHRNFAEWWNAETEYVIQRVERWVAFAKGYNRLRSERLSGGRMSMRKAEQWTYTADDMISTEEPEPAMTIKNTKNGGKTVAEQMKLNCCGTFNYKSNGNLESNCLETYSYDHSIYFKTVGDIKKSKSVQSNLNPDGFSDLNQNDDWNSGFQWKMEIDDFNDEMVEFERHPRKHSFDNENIEDLATLDKQKNIFNRLDSDDFNNNFAMPIFDDKQITIPT